MNTQTPPPSSPISPKPKHQDPNRRVTIVDPKLFPPNQPKKLSQPVDISRELELLPNLQSAMKNGGSGKFKYANNTQNRLKSPLPLPQHPSPRTAINLLQGQHKYQPPQLQPPPIQQSSGGFSIFQKLSAIINYLLPFKLNFTKLFQTTLKGLILITLITLVYMYCWLIYYFFIRTWLTGNGTSNGLKFVDNVWFQFEEGKLPTTNIKFEEFTHFHKFSNNLIYNIKLNLKVPESVINFSLGNFMINISGYAAEDKLIYKVSKPLLMKFRSSLFQIIRTVVLSPFMIFGYFEEYQTLSVDLSPPSYLNNINDLTNLVLTISNPNIQLESANLTLITQLTGLAYYVVNWPLTTGIMITNTLFGMHLILLFLAYQFVKSLLTSSKAKVNADDEDAQSAGANGKTKLQPSQTNLKPHLDLGFEDDEFGELEGTDVLKELEALMDNVKVPGYDEDSLSTSESATAVDLELTSERVAKDLTFGLPPQQNGDELNNGNDDDDDEEDNADGDDSVTQVGSSTGVSSRISGNSNNIEENERLDRAWDTSNSGVRKREVKE